MSANNTNQIKKQIEIPKLKLWLIWLFLFVLPSLATVIGFKYYSKEYSYFTDTDLTTSAFETIRRYNTSIIPENFMEEQISKIKLLDSNCSPEALKDQIDSILCGKTMLCVFFDENVTFASSEKLAAYYSEKYKDMSLYNKDIANQIYNLSKIARRKYDFFKFSAWSCVFGFIFSIVVSFIVWCF